MNDEPRTEWGWIIAGTMVLATFIPFILLMLKCWFLITVAAWKELVFVMQRKNK